MHRLTSEKLVANYLKAYGYYFILYKKYTRMCDLLVSLVHFINKWRYEWLSNIRLRILIHLNKLYYSKYYYFILNFI